MASEAFPSSRGLSPADVFLQISASVSLPVGTLSILLALIG